MRYFMSWIQKWSVFERFIIFNIYIIKYNSTLRVILKKIDFFNILSIISL